MKISEQKAKPTAFVVKQALHTKIVLYNISTERVSHFRYLGFDITYDVDYNVGHKLAKFQSICGTIHQALSRKQGRRLE